jgi:hypothetical protein
MLRPVALSMTFAAILGCGAPRQPGPSEAARLLSAPPLAAGLRLTIAPNLPDVPSGDLPEETEREVEILALSTEQLRLRWSGRVRRETPESAGRRASWLRARTSAGSHEPPPSPVPPLFEESEVTGTLEFSDFGSSRALLLPGLWPEGHVLLRGSSGMWLSSGALAEIAGTRRLVVPFLNARALREPAAALLERASEIAHEREPGSADEWRLLPGAGRSTLEVNGVRGDVATLRLSSWFGTFEVLSDPKNPIVLSVYPSPSSSGLMPLFAPARVMRMLLAYRVVALDGRLAGKPAPGGEGAR